MTKQANQLTLILRCTAEEGTWSMTNLASRLRLELAQHGIELVELLRAIKIPQGDSSSVDNSLTGGVSREPNPATIADARPDTVVTLGNGRPDAEDWNVSEVSRELSVANVVNARIDTMVTFEENLPIGNGDTDDSGASSPPEDEEEEPQEK
jgi:hypothetical protein